MPKPSCETCAFVLLKRTEFTSFECRRNPPVANTTNGWPQVFANDWCGEYKFNGIEEKACKPNLASSFEDK